MGTWVILPLSSGLGASFGIALQGDVVFSVGTSGIKTPGPAKRPKRDKFLNNM